MSALIGFITLSFKLGGPHILGYEWGKEDVRESLLFLFCFLEDEKKGSPMCTVLVYIREFWEGLRGVFIAQKMLERVIMPS